MTAGTVLDEDPVTTAQLSVDTTDGSSVTLLTEAPGVTVRDVRRRQRGAHGAEP